MADIIIGTNDSLSGDVLDTDLLPIIRGGTSILSQPYSQFAAQVRGGLATQGALTGHEGNQNAHWTVATMITAFNTALGGPTWQQGGSSGPPTNAELYEALFLPAAVIAAGSGINLQLDGQNRIATIVNTHDAVSAQAFDFRLSEITVGGVATNVLRDVTMDFQQGAGDLRIRKVGGPRHSRTQARSPCATFIGGMAGANLTYDATAGVINASGGGCGRHHGRYDTNPNSGLAGGAGSGHVALSLDIDNLNSNSTLQRVVDELADYQDSSVTTRKFDDPQSGRPPRGHGLSV